MTMRIPFRLSAAAMLLATFPSTSLAGETRVEGSTLVYEADANETNRVSVMDGGGSPILQPRFMLIFETGADLRNGAGALCEQSTLGPGTLLCERSSGFTDVDIQLKDEDDFTQILGGPQSAMTLVRTRVQGNTGNDVLTGGPSADQLEGDVGDDQLIGGGGQDELYGSWGDDRFESSGDAGISDLVRCGPGFDRVFFNERDDVGVGMCESRTQRP